MPKKFIFDKKNVLIVGGAGFIGSHLCDELLTNAKVICLDNFSSGSEKNIDHLLANPNFKFIKHDITEPITLEDFQELFNFKVEFQGIQEIYNLACPTSPVNFTTNRLATVLANSLGVKNSLDLALKYQAKYLFFSSSVVYGPREQNPRRMNETDIGLVDNLSERCSYDEGKRFAEAMVKTYRDVNNLDAKIIRLFRIYGPRLPLNQGHLIPDFISAALDNKDLIIYGDENFSSSFCYVSDLVAAVDKIIVSDLAGPINIGSDIDLPIKEIAQKIISQIGANSRVTYAKPLTFMTSLALPNISKAREELGWMPIITLEKGLEKTIEDLRASSGLKTFSYQ